MSTNRISLDLVCHLIIDKYNKLPVQTNLQFDSDDPWAIVATFDAAGDSVEWVFSRELLQRGVAKPVGEGDVRVWPALDEENREVVILTLSSPEGSACLVMSHEAVVDFLAHSEEVVVTGEEDCYIDWNEITKLLDESL